MSEIGFVSSRDDRRRPVSFREALLRGLAPDGGLFLPERIADLPDDWLELESFPHLAAAVLARWLPDLPKAELQELVDDALDFEVPLVPLSGDRFVLELFHGPTLSFKDFGARTMARLMSRYLAETGESLTILVATSGDTGSAVADGFSGLPNLRVVLLYPHGKVSPMQERQLIVRRAGVRAFAVRGDFDDCQRLVKAALTDPALRDCRLSSANSINIGRLLPQQLYYLWASSTLARAGVTDEPVFVVPSGNLGNLTGGILAALAGMPAERFVAAHNANGYFPRFLRGAAAPFEFPATVATLSNAMDVGAPSNFERLEALLDDGLSELVWGVEVSDDATLRRIARSYAEDGYLACPHTAVGLEGLERFREEAGVRRPAVALATAHPGKFGAVLDRALGFSPAPPERLAALWRQPVEVAALEPDPAALRAVLGAAD